jgi:Ca2+-binding EF-hand superfamily protein
MMKSTLILSLVSAFLASAVAYAQTMRAYAGEASRPQYHLSKFDEQFRAADKDGDGALTRQEAENAGLRRIVENFDRIDVNKDGKATRAEMRALIVSHLSS